MGRTRVSSRGDKVAFSLKSLLPARLRGDMPVIPVVRLAGVIGGGGPLRQGLALESLVGPLGRAFAVKKAPAVALIVNSPGGAAAQSHLIFRHIRALAEEKHKKVIVAVEDLAASGGYMIAAAGDEIIVDEGSIVGSIGVVSAGFGFTGLIERIGVERRVHTAGKSKAMLDPFRPEREEDVARLTAIQEDVHAAFIGLVKARRGAKLADDPDLFSGAFWSGKTAVDLGLADRTGDLRSVLREAVRRQGAAQDDPDGEEHAAPAPGAWRRQRPPCRGPRRPALRHARRACGVEPLRLVGPTHEPSRTHCDPLYHRRLRLVAGAAADRAGEGALPQRAQARAGAGTGAGPAHPGEGPGDRRLSPAQGVTLPSLDPAPP